MNDTPASCPISIPWAPASWRKNPSPQRIGSPGTSLCGRTISATHLAGTIFPANKARQKLLKSATVAYAPPSPPPRRKGGSGGPGREFFRAQELGVAPPGRLADPGPHQVVVRHATGPLGDQRQHHVTAVAVGEPSPGGNL